MTEMTTQYEITAGTPQPFGATRTENRTNFAINSTMAQTMSLCLFNPGDTDPFLEVSLDHDQHRTGSVWHAAVENLPDNVEYGYRLSNQELTPLNLVLDPYAKKLVSSHKWGDHSDVKHLCKAGFPCRGALPSSESFDWQGVEKPDIDEQDLVIYEMHVRGFTQHKSSGVKHPGTFLGVIEKIPYLLDLGINAVELLPVYEFNELEFPRENPENGETLYNYWGYSTVNFFTPMNRYAVEDAITEFKTMVRELHRAGIEVILDVVYNHTGEGGAGGPAFTFKALDKYIYYMINAEGYYLNYSGCGNTFNTNHAVVQDFIIESLRYWSSEMGVDGFRFDLASIFVRDTNGHPLENAPIIEAISHDPILADTKLIAEAWDAAGLYHVGSFAGHHPRWLEWNGKYRDNIRRFIKGTPGESTSFATRLCGSEDLYGYKRNPYNSVNFIISHDGFSLADLVSYNHKHNLANGEDNRDGNNDNDSWNCGHEGLSEDENVLHLRQRQIRNFQMALMLSQGIPMIHMGDEYAHTKGGNNNTWCQDNEFNWMLWDELKHNDEYMRFFKKMIAFRNDNPAVKREHFLREQDIEWHGMKPGCPNWDYEGRFIAFSLKDDKGRDDIYIAFNAHHFPVTVQMPQPRRGHRWHCIANTVLQPPYDFDDEPIMMIVTSMRMLPHSAILMRSMKP